MAIALGRLIDISGAADPVSIMQTDLEILSQELYSFTPSYQSNVPTTIIGPPTSGAHVLNEYWRDALGALWRCTVATPNPGTWIQVQDAVAATLPSTGTIPVGYILQYTDGTHGLNRRFQHTGTYHWKQIDVPLNFISLTATVGGVAGCLDFIPTVGLDAGTVVVMARAADSNLAYFYLLRADSTGTSDPNIIRPLDYNATTNIKSWWKISPAA